MAKLVTCQAMQDCNLQTEISSKLLLCPIELRAFHRNENSLFFPSKKGPIEGGWGQLDVSHFYKQFSILSGHHCTGQINLKPTRATSAGFWGGIDYLWIFNTRGTKSNEPQNRPTNTWKSFGAILASWVHFSSFNFVEMGRAILNQFFIMSVGYFLAIYSSFHGNILIWIEMTAYWNKELYSQKSSQHVKKKIYLQILMGKFNQKTYFIWYLFF